MNGWVGEWVSDIHYMCLYPIVDLHCISKAPTDAAAEITCT